ncbi:DUF2568 domain-containing protein [Nocardia sp. NPDC002869]|uniref:DUF2568 domain-containing protein n=1 Tax=Nocardia sp. NPDC002869 TaxID=3161032 RepID=UPI00398CB70C
MVLLPVIAATAWGVIAVPDDPSRSGAAPVAVPGAIRLLVEFAVLFGGAAALFRRATAARAGVRRDPAGLPPARLQPGALAVAPLSHRPHRVSGGGWCAAYPASWHWSASAPWAWPDPHCAS